MITYIKKKWPVFFCGITDEFGILSMADFLFVVVVK